MLYIEKKPCPPDVAEKANELMATQRWQDLPESGETQTVREEFFDQLPKKSIREALWEEQHGLCAYCMSQIVNDPLHMTIEHCKPLSKNKSFALDYSNFLGVCKGGSDVLIPKGSRIKRIICCDAKKGDEDEMRIDPLNYEMMQHIAYTSEGIIYYEDDDPTVVEAMHKDLWETLFLNGKMDTVHMLSEKDTTTGLVLGRKRAYEEGRSYLEKLQKQKKLTPEKLREIIKAYEEANPRKPFVGATLFVLRQRYERLLQKTKEAT